MSLIFKSLKKLKAPSVESEKTKKPDAGNVYTFRKLIVSPQALILLFILMIIAGYVASQGYHFFLNRFVSREKPPADLAVKTGSHSTALKRKPLNDNTQHYNEDSIPTPPETVPVTDGTPGKLALPSTAITESSPAPAENNTGSSIESGSSPEHSFTTAFLSSSSLPERKVNYGYPSTGLTEPVSKAAKSTLSSDDKQRRDMLNKQFTTARLVTKIEQSLAEKDFDSAEALLAKIAAQKGKRSGYVLKLKAFLLIQKEKYPEAEDILKELLSRNRTDLNAGMNMAVVEAKTDRLQSAYERLKHLSRLYPENPDVQSLMARFR